MRINPWFANSEIEGIGPKVKCYTLRLYDEHFPKGLLCDMAWTSEDETQEHFWAKDKRDVRVEKMTVRQYLRLHLLTIRGMNPFWDLGRSEFLRRYMRKYKLNIL